MDTIDHARLLDLFFEQSIDGVFFMMLDTPIAWNDHIDKDATLETVFAQQRITKINQAMLEQYLAKEEDFIGLTPNDFFAHNLEHGKAVWREFFDKGKLHIDTDEQKFDGTPMTVIGDYICIYNSDGNILGHFGVQREVTNERAYQKELEIAKSKAEAANQAKSEFLANMSHEIRTPMNAVIGLSEILGGMTLEAQQKELVEKIYSSSKILLGIINDILDYSKIEAGALILEHQPFALQEIQKSLETLFGQAAEAKGIDLVIDYDRALPAVVVSDALRLTQVVTNLVSNAVKFTKSGTVHVTMALLERPSDTKARMRFCVKDSGIGMNQAQIEKLFEPFMQADSSTTREYGGTGLGLVITKKIIEALGGVIEIHSVPHEGTKVTFTLELEVQNWETHTTPPAQEMVAHTFQKGLKVLLVEDNEINQMVATMMLEEVGIAVDVAHNGEEGARMYLANPQKYALILMDLQMPVLSGYEAAKRIRAHDDKVPIIALTAAAMIEDKQKALQAGMNDHLGKPIDKNALYALITHYTHTPIEAASAASKTHEQGAVDLDALYAMTSSKELAHTLIKKLHDQLIQGTFASLVASIENDEDNAPQLIHTLKGVSGNIHATQLFNLSQSMDAKYKTHQTITPQEIDALKNAIEDFLAYAACLPTLTANTIVPHFDANALLEEIQTSLKNSKPLSQEKLAQLTEFLGTRIERATLEHFVVLVEAFEFDEALEILQGWKL